MTSLKIEDRHKALTAIEVYNRADGIWIQTPTYAFRLTVDETQKLAANLFAALSLRAAFPKEPADAS